MGGAPTFDQEGADLLQRGRIHATGRRRADKGGNRSGKTISEIAAKLEEWGAAPRADVDSVALAEAARLRGERS